MASDSDVATAHVRDESVAVHSIDDASGRRAVLSGMIQLTHMLNEAIDMTTGAEFRSNQELVVLFSIRLDGPQRPRELAELTGFTRGGTTNLIDRLAAHDLVARAEVADDRRGVLVELTGRGATVVEDVASAAQRVISFARPLIEGWAPHFGASGCELGPMRVPRGLDKTLEFVRELSDAGLTIGPAYRKAFGADDPTPNLTLHVLLLATEPGGTRPTWIGDATYLSSASVSDLLDRLEERGLVTRAAGAESDRRVTVVTATDRGRRALDVVIANSDPVIRASASVLFPPVPNPS